MCYMTLCFFLHDQIALGQQAEKNKLVSACSISYSGSIIPIFRYFIQFVRTEDLSALLYPSPTAAFDAIDMFELHHYKEFERDGWIQSQLFLQIFGDFLPT